MPHVLVDYVPHEIGINVGYWCSVSHALNCFVAESFMDELAAAARKDPVQFRFSLLEKQPRYRAVLERAVQEAGYGSAPRGITQGVALMEGYGTYMAQVADISLEQGKLRVHRIVCALDCGQVINPSIVTAQVESSVIFGLTAALWGEINLREGRSQQTNFDSYRLMRMSEVPRSTRSSCRARKHRVASASPRPRSSPPRSATRSSRRLGSACAHCPSRGTGSPERDLSGASSRRRRAAGWSGPAGPRAPT